MAARGTDAWPPPTRLRPPATEGTSTRRKAAVKTKAREARRHLRPEPEPYQIYRQPLQAKWRPVILQRDGSRCRACRSSEDPEVAHITDAVAFVRAASNQARAVTFSYRWDNLVTLCQACHRASHRFRFEMDDVPRRDAVDQLFVALRRVRGWSSPYAVLPPMLVPPALRPARSFHDVMRLSPLVPFPTYARYASDGGLVFGDEERAPGQGTLPSDSPELVPSATGESTVRGDGKSERNGRIGTGGAAMALPTAI